MQKTSTKHSISIFFSVLLLFFASGCNTLKKVKKDEQLLLKNKIIDRSASLFELNPDVEPTEIEGYIKQKPNRKVLVFRFYLNVYNLINEDRTKRKKYKRDLRYDKINTERIKKAQIENQKREVQNTKRKKKLPPKNPKLKDKDKLTWREWVMSIGEPPVIYDSSLKERSTEQIKMFLKNKGYFNSTVKDSVSVKKRKATVYYIISPSKPYKINSITYSIDDDLLAYYVFGDTANTLIKKGKNYDVDVFQNERERITKYLRNNGYYYFTKDYIYYRIDSSLKNNTVNIELGIKKQAIKIEGQDSVKEKNHDRYYINQIFITTDYNPKLKKTPSDTILFNDYYFLTSSGFAYKPKVITDALFISPGALYQSNNGELSYKRLSEMRAFKFINIQYIDNGDKTLDCVILLAPILKQSFTIEGDGTNTGGNLGTSGSFSYQNRNVFKGAEIFEIKIKGGLEIQKTLTENKDENNNIISESVIPFNTLEFGPEVNLTIPRFLVPFKLRVSKNANPKTIFKSSYNYQQRPDYTRSSLLLSYGYNWRETQFKRHAFYPIEVNLIKLVNSSDEFQEFIQNSSDPLLVYRYSDHFLTDTRYNFIFTNQTLNKKKGFVFFRANLESSGNILRGIYNLSNAWITPMPKEENSYTIGGVRFAQYLRADFDFRKYFILDESNSIVCRMYAGVGKPLHNLRELPLEKSFFGGGPNGMRAWKARTLGPGSFFDPSQTNFDKVGDNQFEANLEYRFNIIKVLNAAAFIDAGNIWIRKPDPNRPGADFKFNFSTLDAIAIGAGLGIRLDFSFFIIRFDAAVPIKDPALEQGSRWTFNKQPLKRTNLNFGIGYPF
jgi:outer membrane protein assembly factor BamA